MIARSRARDHRSATTCAIRSNFALKTGVIVPLPIPTTILVDAAGTVRWIDQATDYMRRSDPERVLAAIRMLDADAPPGARRDAPHRMMTLSAPLVGAC